MQKFKHEIQVVQWYKGTMARRHIRHRLYNGVMAQIIFFPNNN